jgi:hypothetical protein
MWGGSRAVDKYSGQNYEHRRGGVENRKYHYWRSGLGEHYLVQLKIETDLGYVNSATEGGNVRPHDPKKEQRRNGF